MRALRSILLLAPFALAGCSVANAGPDSLVARCLAAHGGRDAILAHPALLERGTVTSLLHSGKGRTARAFVRPGRLRVETAYPDGTGEIRALDGDRGWRDQVPVEGDPLDAMRLQAARIDAAGLLADPSAHPVDEESWTIDGRTIRVLSLSLGGSPAMKSMRLEIGVDPESARIVRTRTVSSSHGHPITFMTTYSDYRVVSGVLVAFHEENWANGQTTGETVLDAVELPRSLPDELFRPDPSPPRDLRTSPSGI